MDLLLAAGYDSSSSSSSSEPPSKKNDSLREGNAQNALHGHTTNNSPRLGHNDDSSPSTADGNAAKKRGSHHSPRSPVAVKKRKLAQSITIANYDTDCQQSDQSFERSNPHWEGRWAGHIYIPFPNLDSCDNDASTHDEFNHETDTNILAERDSDSDSDESNSSSIEEEYLQSSRSFLSAARALIHYWAALLDEGCIDYDDTVSKRVIVPHVSMSPKKTKTKSVQTTNNQVIQNNKTYLHISLSRPIYLPAPSVDSFLADISSSLAPVTRNAQQGKTIHLRPHNATIFINDNHTRSFLSIPMSEESSRWAKRLLLPPIDAAMSRFGQKKYYDEGIMHVSIASIKGNVIPIILKNRRNGYVQSTSETESKFNSISLFQTRGCNQLEDETRNDMPESIPIRLDRIQCDFGKVKNVVLPL